MISANTMQSRPLRSDRSKRLAALRRRISRIEGYGSKDAGFTEMEHGAVNDPPLIGKEDSKPAFHELVASGYLDQPAARDFALALIASLMHRQSADQSMVLWCQRTLDSAEFGRLYGPGLKALGLPPERFLMVTGKRDADCLWAMEQGLASRALFAVVGAIDHVNLIASRRLSLAASAHGTFCFLLPLHHGRDPSAARTRWRIRSAPSTPDHLDPKGLGKPAWHLDLERSPNGRIGHWTVEWNHAAHHFHLAAARRSCLDEIAERCSSERQASDVVAFERTG